METYRPGDVIPFATTFRQTDGTPINATNARVVFPVAIAGTASVAIAEIGSNTGQYSADWAVPTSALAGVYRYWFEGTYSPYVGAPPETTASNIDQFTLISALAAPATAVGLTNKVAFTTVGQIQEVLGTDFSATLIQQRIVAVSAMIENYCSRSFRQTVVDTTNPEQLRGSGRTILPLARFPITAVSRVRIDTTDITDYSRSLDFDTWGMLYRVTRWPISAPTFGDVTLDADTNMKGYNIDVAYTAGYVLPNDSTGTRNFPYDLEEVCINEVVDRIAQPVRGIKHERTAGAQLQEYFARAGGFLADSLTVMDRYKRSYV